MNEIKYEIVRDSKEDRPYIKLSDDFEDGADHNFYTIELARTLFANMVVNNSDREKEGVMKDNEFNELKHTSNFINFIADRFAIIMAGQMDAVEDANDLINPKSDFND
jgi:hypothetical protein